MEDIIAVEKVAVIANGAIESYDDISVAMKGYDLYIAIDGGLNHCEDLGITPLFLIGDMDSVDNEVRKKFPHIKEITFERNKDETDLELGLEFLIKKEPRSITIFGGFGHRADHSFTNAMLLSRYKGKVFLETETEILGVIDETVELSTREGQILSLIPLNGPVYGVSTDGLKWELDNDTLDKNFIGISNEATGTSILVTVKSGDLLYSIHK